MAKNVPFSIRLSPRLAVALDRVAEHLNCSPSQMAEALLRRSDAHQKEILAVSLPGPFPEKRNIRLTPETRNLLRQVGDGIEPAAYVRQVLGYFLTNLDVLRATFPTLRALSDEDLAPEPAPGEERGRIARGTPIRAGPAPGAFWGLVLLVGVMVAIPLLLYGVIILIEWLNDRRMKGRAKQAEDKDDGQKPPSPEGLAD